MIVTDYANKQHNMRLKQIDRKRRVDWRIECENCDERMDFGTKRAALKAMSLHVGRELNLEEGL